MKQKASFLCVPCYFDSDTSELSPRYGKVNDILLSAMIEIWWTLGTLLESCAGYFPIKILEKGGN